jgi:dynamin 1-like protein
VRVITESLLVSYFSIVRKNVQDSVPKAIMHFLVNKSKQDLQNELVSNLYKEELFDELLVESAEIAAKRKACWQMVQVLSRANLILTDLRESAVARV